MSKFKFLPSTKNITYSFSKINGTSPSQIKKNSKFCEQKICMCIVFVIDNSNKKTTFVLVYFQEINSTENKINKTLTMFAYVKKKEICSRKRNMILCIKKGM